MDPSLTKDKEGNWIKDEDIKIFDLTYDEISKFDVGSLNKLTRYGRRFVNQRSLENQKIPKLSELLELSSKNDCFGLKTLYILAPSITEAFFDKFILK